jgi:hypothetical protein
VVEGLDTTSDYTSDYTESFGSPEGREGDQHGPSHSLGLRCRDEGRVFAARTNNRFANPAAVVQTARTAQ